jgi:hypothetical protein
MKGKIILELFIFFSVALVFGFLFSAHYVSADKPTFSIDITSPISGPVTNPVQISGTVASTNFPGSLSAYSIQIDWNDSSTPTDLTRDSTHLILTPSADGKDFSGTFTTSTDLAHTYTTSGSFTIKATLCHESCTGAEGASATDSVTITISPTCGITANLNPSFGSTTTGTITPDDSVASTVSTTITNTGTTATISLTIEGTEWKIGGTTSSSPVSFVVESTHYSETDTDAYSSMTQLSGTATTVHSGTLGSSASFTHFFRVKPPLGVDAGSYEQTITYTSGC